MGGTEGNGGWAASSKNKDLKRQRGNVLLPLCIKHVWPENTGQSLQGEAFHFSTSVGNTCTHSH